MKKLFGILIVLFLFVSCTSTKAVLFEEVAGGSKVTVYPDEMKKDLKEVDFWIGYTNNLKLLKKYQRDNLRQSKNWFTYFQHKGYDTLCSIGFQHIKLRSYTTRCKKLLMKEGISKGSLKYLEYLKNKNFKVIYNYRIWG